MSVPAFPRRHTASARVITCAAVWCLASCLIAPDGAAAQAVADTERALLPLQADVLADAPPPFWDGLAFARAEEDRQRSLRADITFGLNGDETDARSLFRFNTGIALARAAFPSEVTVVSRLALQLRDGEVQEDVTSLQISYDYHSHHGVEYFAFAERFADNFLSIQQRYEVGFGARTGLNLGRVGGWETVDAHFGSVRAGLPLVAEALARRSQIERAQRPGPEPADLARLTRSLDYLQRSYRDRQARLFVGLAASVFAELERAEIEVVRSDPAADGGAVPVRVKVPLAGTHRYRLSLRPTLRLRPSSDVIISVLPYFKLPLDGPRWGTDASGARRLDYRRDLYTEMVWGIRQDHSGIEHVDFVATLSHFFDNIPPALPAALVRDASAEGRTFNRLTADNSHRLATLSLRLRW